MLRPVRVALFVLAVCSVGFAKPRKSLDEVLRTQFSGKTGAVVVLRTRDGAVIAMHNPQLLSRRAATPGSAIKPFVLQLLLEKNAVSPDTEIGCLRRLTVAGHELNCSHPASLSSLRAEEALAYSCNSFFVTAVTRLGRGELQKRFAELNFNHTTGILPGEGAGRISPEHSLSDRQLLAVGASGIQITPIELASAYLRLARIDEQRANVAERTVLAGLRDATEYGLAQAARPEQISVAGKTGTAADPDNPHTHAWFAGFAPATRPEIVVVVFLERGRGGVEAAGIAREIFSYYAEERR